RMSELCNPFRVFNTGLTSRNILNMFRISKNHIKLSFGKNIECRNLILTSTFHKNINLENKITDKGRRKVFNGTLTYIRKVYEMWNHQPFSFEYCKKEAKTSMIKLG